MNSFRSGESTRKRLKRIPTINLNATHWTQLIDLTLCGIFEPPMMEAFSESELRESLLNGTKLDLPDLPSHSQAMERAVKLSTEASQTVHCFEARHQHITAKLFIYLFIYLSIYSVSIEPLNYVTYVQRLCTI